MRRDALGNLGIQANLGEIFEFIDHEYWAEAALLDQEIPQLPGDGTASRSR